MLLNKTFIDGDDGDVIIKKTHDAEPVLNRASDLRSNGMEDFGESKLVGTIPMWLYYEWLKEAGVNPTDHEAARDVMNKKLMSGEFSKFRVWQGNY